MNENDAVWRDFVISGENSVVKTWLRRGAAGWRLDVADELPDEALALIRRAAKEADPDAVILGEVWEDAVTKTSYGARRKYALGDSLDSVMNYPFRTALLNFLTFRSDSRAIADFLLDQRLNYPPALYFSVMNLISSPDVDRARTALATRLDARSMTREQQAGFIVTNAQDERGAAMQRLAAAVQFTIPGVPSIYYGDETGMNGMLDPFDRAPFTVGRRSLVDWYSTLSELRNENDALSVGAVGFSAPDPDVLTILRCVSGGRDEFGLEAEDGVFLAVINRSAYEKSIVADIWAGHAGLTAFQGSDLGLQHRGGGVGQAGVDIARFFTGEAAPALLTAVKYEGGRLENGCGQRAVLGVLDIACVDRFGTEAEVLIVHIRILLIIAGRRSGSFIVLLHSKSTTNTAGTGISKIPWPDIYFSDSSGSAQSTLPLVKNI